jgi:hypothetical protein
VTDVPTEQIDFLCFFCGLGATEPELTLAASWIEDGVSQEQFWAAHRQCLIDAMAPDVRFFGGPLTRD